MRGSRNTQYRQEAPTSRDGSTRISFGPPTTGRFATFRGLAFDAMSRAHGPAAEDDSLALRLGRGPDAAATARGALARLRADLDPPLMETLRLLVTELVTNSVKHAGADTVNLRVTVRPASVWTEVRDEGPGFDPSPPARPETTAAAGACSWWSGSPTAGAPPATPTARGSGSNCAAASSDRLPPGSLPRAVLPPRRGAEPVRPGGARSPLA